MDPKSESHSSSVGSNDTSASTPAPEQTNGQKGGVGAGLATESWWDQYYRQMHYSYFDWYLPNEIVVQTILQQGKLQCGIQESKDEDDAENANTTESENQPTPESSSSSSTPLSSLPILQLGCGNSEVTADLWTAGLTYMHNVDFSSECITKMKEMQKEKGWFAYSNGNGKKQKESESTFRFEAMDVRELRYDDASYQMVFDKGTLDCVSLESADRDASACAMLKEVHRVLKPGGVYVCFSLYPPAARAKYFISVLSVEQGGEDEVEKKELCEVMETDNPPMHLQTIAWDLRMVALDHSPLELPNQPHTYLYIAKKK